MKQVYFAFSVLCSCFFSCSRLPPPPRLAAQALCRAVSVCNKEDLKVEIVKVDTNVTSGCPHDTLCGNGDRFHQLFYKVYLRYSTLNMDADTAEFDLDYSRLQVGVGFNLPVYYSHISDTATQLCFENGPLANNNWDPNEVLFKVEDGNTTAVIDFHNNSDPANACGSSGARIHFTWTAPFHVDGCTVNRVCAYAELFTIVVNAYPEEYIKMDTTSLEYELYDTEISACAITRHNAGTYNGINSIHVIKPDDADGTANERLLARILDPVANGQAGQDFGVAIKNYGGDATLYFLEFVVRATPDSLNTSPLSFSGTYQPLPPLISGGSRLLHYIIEIPGGLTLLSGAEDTLGFITVNPPVLQNQGWSVALQLEEAEKTRVKSSVCTELPITNEQVSFSESGDPHCNYNYEFRVELDETNGDLCSGPGIVKAGLRRTSSSGPLNLRHFKFELEFDLTGDISITGVNYDDWVNPGWFCPASNSVACDSNCYTIDGNTITFCFSVPASGSDWVVLDSLDFINIEFSNDPGCINGVTVNYLQIGIRTTQGASETLCIPSINTADNGLPACPPQIKGTILTENSLGVEDVEISISLTPPNGSQPAVCDTTLCSTVTMLTSSAGNYGICPCDSCLFTVTPYKNDNSLSGVTTYDLVLISKHILGIEALGSPYRMIAADANKSNSITTFDIVEIRKLILGIYDTFPSNTSWRFVDAAYNFPDPSNPFTTPYFPEKVDSIDMTASQFNSADFTGIKIGDVNNSAIPNGQRPAVRPSAPVSSTAITHGRNSTAIVYPVVYTGEDILQAIQIGLRFDPLRLEFTGTSRGDLSDFDPGSIGLTKTPQGQIRALWLPSDISDPEQVIRPGTVLFYLTFHRLDAEQNIPSLIVDQNVLFSAAWAADGREYEVVPGEPADIRIDAFSTSVGLEARCVPNPTGSAGHLQVRASAEADYTLALFGPYGNRILMRPVHLITGEQVIELPETGSLPPGVYQWKIYRRGQKVQGRLVKL